MARRLGLIFFLAILLVLCVTPSRLEAQSLQSQDAPLLQDHFEAPGYLARVVPNSTESLHQALLRAEMLFLDGRLRGPLPPAVLVVHGPNVAAFFRQNYRQHKSLVDLAARLSAFQVIEIRVCETSTGELGQALDVLMPFVTTVTFGPDEVKRLTQQEGFVNF